MLIRYCISMGLEGLADKGKEWISLATAAVDEDGDDVRVLEIILRRMGEMEPDPREKQQQRLREFVERLTAFTAVAGELNAHFKGLIAKAENPADATSKTEGD
jgi:hypothetical protein